ncbi:MAG: oligosaccharide flippase family protein, partial [Chthoniobacterales bacterium]
SIKPLFPPTSAGMSKPGLPVTENVALAHGVALARGAILNAAAFLASNLRGIFILLVARLLGSSVLGIFGLAWASMDFLSKFATLGLDYSAIAFVAKAEAVGDRAASRRIMRSALTISLGASVALAGLGGWFAWTIGPRLGYQPELVRATAVMLLALPGLVLYRVSNALSRGMGVMHHDIFSRGLTESLGTAVALLVALLVGMNRLAPEVAAIAGTLVSGLVAFFLARRLYRMTPEVEPVPHSHSHLTRKLMRASAPIALYDLLNLGVMHIDVIMLGLFVGRAPGVTIETLGIYAAAVQIGGGLRKISQAFTPIFTPVVARHLVQAELRNAEESYGYLARWMLALLLPAVAVLSLSGGAIMTIFGPTFSSGYAWVAIIGSACAINAFVSLGETILMVERPHLNLINSAIVFAAAVGFNLVFIPAFGALGAALGMLVPYSLQGILRGVEIPLLLQWRWPWRALLKPWIAALLPLPVAFLARQAVAGNIGQLASVALYLIGYVLAWRAIGMDEGDRAVLDHLFRRRKTGRKSKAQITNL